MHWEAFQFVWAVKASFPERFQSPAVLEIGSLSKCVMLSVT